MAGVVFDDVDGLREFNGRPSGVPVYIFRVILFVILLALGGNGEEEGFFVAPGLSLRNPLRIVQDPVLSTEKIPEEKSSVRKDGERDMFISGDECFCVGVLRVVCFKELPGQFER